VITSKPSRNDLERSRKTTGNYSNEKLSLERMIEIYSDKTLSLDRQIKFQFSIDSDQNIQTIAKVVWKQKIDKKIPAKYKIGLEFDNLSEDYFSILANLEYHLLLTTDGRLKTIVADVCLPVETSVA
jgi:hypothetical protein